uniref:Major facilitator superfamily (MFS) profile domain-containing protein n=1 Tax=Bionectria ochroleuca TaxID=29856 RepID=A0A8H7KFV1_BIOOC
MAALTKLEHNPAEEAQIEAAATTSTTTMSRKSPSFYLAVFGISMVALITAWDATSLAGALPTITSQLINGTTFESFWAGIAFMLGIAPPLHVSIALFDVGAIIFAIAKNVATLITGCLIQGLGGGGLYVLQDIILAEITSLKERPVYLAIVACAMALGTVLGPIIGGLFADHANWRWIGWINLHFAGVGLAIFIFFLRLRPLPTSLQEKIGRLDLFEMLLFAAGATAVALPLSWADALYPWASWITFVPLIIGLLVLLGFGVYEGRFPVVPIVPFRIFTNITSISSISLYFQAVYLEQPIQAAKSTLLVCAAMVVFSFVAPIIIEVSRRYRLLLWSCWLLLTLFMGLLCLIDQNSPRAQIYAFQCLLGIGIGIVFTGGQVPMQARVEHVDNTGLAVGTLIVVRIFGALVGLCIGSTVFSSVLAKSIAGLGTLPEPVKILENPIQATEFIPALRMLDLAEEFMRELIDAYRKPFVAIQIAMTCLSGVGFLTSLLVKELTLDREEVGRQGFEES